MLPKIPTIIFVLTRPNPDSSLPFRKEFNSYIELCSWVYQNDKTAQKQIIEEYDQLHPRDKQDYTSYDWFCSFVSPHVNDRIFGENGYFLYKKEIADSTDEKVKGM